MATWGLGLTISGPSADSAMYVGGFPTYEAAAEALAAAIDTYSAPATDIRGQIFGPLGEGGDVGSTVDQGAPGSSPWPVSVSNLPATQPVSGTVAVSNLPATQPVSGAVSVSGTVSVGNFPATQPISGSVAVSNFPTDIAAAGNVSAVGQSITLDTEGYGAVGLQTTGTWTGTLVAEASMDEGTTWASTTIVEVSSGILASAWTANITAQLNCAGMSQIRVRARAWTSGTASIVLRATANVASVMLDNPIPGGTNTIGAVLQSGSWTTAVSNFPGSQAVTGPLTDAQLRATPVPVSGTITANVGSGTQPVSGTVSVDNFPATQAVTGTFFQATQPVSGTFFQATQPVSAAALPLPSGASTEATLALIKAKTDNLDVALSTRTKPADTQTVSGSVSVSNFPATQPVSGTVTATGPLTDTQLRASAVPVSGTFFQATQPVSGTITANAGSGTFTVSGPLTDTQLRASAVPVSGTVTANQGGTWTVQPGNTANTTAWKVDGSAVTQPVSGTVTANAPTLTKGTQGSTGFSTQDLKDSGRVIKTFTAAFTAATTEAMVTLTPNTDGTEGSTGTSFAVTSNKRLRLEALMITCFNATAAIHSCRINLRMSSSGAVTTSSPTIATVATTTQAATANLTSSQAQALPDGLELSGTMQVGISQTGIALAGQTVVLVGYEY